MSILPWIAHLYTATGIVIAFLATVLAFDRAFRSVFILLVVATAIDATDGWLARLARVTERLPQIDGALMDNIIDYLTYAFIPALIVWQAGLVPVPFPICAAMLISSLYGFAHSEAKVEHDGEHFFTGFPSYWNIVVAYLYMAKQPGSVNAVVLAVLAVLVFVPIRYLYPSRMKTLQVPTLVLGTMWSVLFAWMIWRLPATDGPWLLLSLIFPVYYTALSLWLQFRR
ncbi:MAG TPA: CDP-alcohol phosphatidyltransferase family protein [Vicinamibacterales bacterium]|nr:CDP-alcohol phosphatidyltransferase family protein [Vicinamibacterales bacterium]